MIVALEEAKRKLTALYDVVGELKNQLRIDEAKERCADLERETMVQDSPQIYPPMTRCKYALYK